MTHFLLEESEYTRDLNILEHYQQDAAYYLARQTGRHYNECLDFVRRTVRSDGKLPLTDPDTLVLSKETPGNREPIIMPFSRYLQEGVELGNIMSPTMAQYTNPNVKRSLLSLYIDGNIKKRNVAKDEMFAAQVAGREVEREIKAGEQTSLKVKNNSLSGAHVSPYTILYNKSAHSTLTSTCRSATSYANANNEKFLMGNRHYWAPDVVKANIISIVRNTDLNLLREAMETYGIRPPTVDETMHCIRYSSDLYWKSNKEMELIESLVSALDDLERSAFVYVGDLYHLAKMNDQVVRDFLDRMSQVAETPHPEPEPIVKGMDEDTAALVKYLCVDQVKGRNLKDVQAQEPESYGIVAATAQNVYDTLDHYKLLIRALWTTANVPASVASVPTIIRRSAMASDTDSTIFTVQYWTTWFTGKLDFSKKSNAIRDVMAFLTSKQITHILRIMTANMGVIPEHRPLLSMKNEYTFPVFSLTSRAKHYYAFVSAQEGNVFDKFDLEIKGVALRNSNSPEHIRERSREMIVKIMQDVVDGNQTSAEDVLRHVADIETEIRDSILAGKYDYFNAANIKPKESYKNPESSPYRHYLMWEHVFAPKYGHADQPPYPAIKVSLDVRNATALRDWVAAIEDRSVADRLADWIKTNGLTNITTLLLPESVMQLTGVPQEIIQVVNVRKLIAETMEPFYLILESLGLSMLDEHNTKLVLDHYS